MSAAVVVALAFAIGFVAGLRSMTAPAVVSWAVRLGWLDLEGTPLGFMGSTVAVAIFTLGAVAELVVDLLPKTPPRTALGPLAARVLTGGLSGACLCVAGDVSWLAGAGVGALGGVIGAFVGYLARIRLVARLGVSDAFVAVGEDVVAIGLAVLSVAAA